MGVANKLEIWSRERYEKNIASAEQAAEIAERIAELAHRP